MGWFNWIFVNVDNTLQYNQQQNDRKQTTSSQTILKQWAKIFHNIDSYQIEFIDKRKIIVRQILEDPFLQVYSNG